MIKFIILFASCFCVNPNCFKDICPDPTHTIEDHGDCPLEHVTHTLPPTGGETGNGPKPPAPPPPGGGN